MSLSQSDLDSMLQGVLASIAKECGKTQDDLSVGLYRTLVVFGQQCFELGIEDAHGRPTIMSPKPFPAVEIDPNVHPNDPRLEHRSSKAVPPPIPVNYRKR